MFKILMKSNFFFEGRFLKPDKNYKFSCWVGLETEKQSDNIDQKHIVQVWLRYKYRDNSKVKHKLLSKTYQLVNGKWS